MFRVLCKDNNHYLLEVKDEIILFNSIYRIDLRDENESIIYLYFESKGLVINEIIWGINLEETYSKESNIKSYMAFEESIKNVNVITEDELKSLLPISVNGDYEDPFNPFSDAF